MNSLVIYDYYNNKFRTDGLAGTITSCTSHNGSGTFWIVVNRNESNGDKNEKCNCAKRN